jgi:hypothetical protein
MLKPIGDGAEQWVTVMENIQLSFTPFLSHKRVLYKNGNSYTVVNQIGLFESLFYLVTGNVSFNPHGFFPKLSLILRSK